MVIGRQSDILSLLNIIKFHTSDQVSRVICANISRNFDQSSQGYLVLLYEYDQPLLITHFVICICNSILFHLHDCDKDNQHACDKLAYLNHSFVVIVKVMSTGILCAVRSHALLSWYCVNSPAFIYLLTEQEQHM